jgi:hypothetical protein
MNQENIHRYKNGTLNSVNVTSFTTGSIATTAIKGTPSPINSLNINIPSQRALAESAKANHAKADAIIGPKGGDQQRRHGPRDCHKIAIRQVSY